jgi:flagellar hook-basal body complex protein FliE
MWEVSRDTTEGTMKRIQGLAAVLAVAALAGGGAVAAASSNGSAGTGTGTTTTGTGTTTTTTPAPPRPHPGPRLGGFGGGLGFFDAATTTALKETFAAVQTAQKTATDAGKAPDDVRDAAVAAAKARLDQAVSDGALTKAQGAAVLAALTKQLGARAAVLDAAATALKLAPADLAKKLAAGDRLDEIAKAQGVDIQDVVSAIRKAMQAQGGGGPGIFGRGGFGFGFGFGGPGKGGPGMGGRFGHHGFGDKGPGHVWDKGGKAPAPPTPTQPSTQSGSFSPRPSATTHI